jgi:SulP family sulfate permease
MYVAPIDSAQYARSVREDTAELASYALADKASVQSASPRQRLGQTQLESYFTQGSEDEGTVNRAGNGLHRHTIAEVSEPVSPEIGPMSRSPGKSALTNMLKRSPPSTSPPNVDGDDDDKLNPTVGGKEDAEGPSRLDIKPHGATVDSSERTPLLWKDSAFETHHPDWIRGQQDMERQEVRRRVSWPKLRNVVRWPRQRGLDIVRTVVNPKSWDRKAIVQRAVVEPFGYLPAVILGLLLNILDALSYGALFVSSFCFVFRNNGTLSRSFASSLCLNFVCLYEDIFLLTTYYRDDFVSSWATNLREAWFCRYLHVLYQLHHFTACVLMWREHL